MVLDVETILFDLGVLLNNFLGRLVDLIVRSFVLDDHPRVQNIMPVLVLPEVHVPALLDSVNLQNLPTVTHSPNQTLTCFSSYFWLTA